ncbi:MAG: hypothetical protein GF329_17765 [Candidatus Lokiarchaeota archaeon]|nr:hypothetical protein [Candidatus Lokiarchaeota archaeon]
MKKAESDREILIELEDTLGRSLSSKEVCFKNDRIIRLFIKYAEIDFFPECITKLKSLKELQLRNFNLK